MSRNYGWGSRDMADAGRIALQARNKGFETVASHIQRFQQFKAFCKSQGIGRMERVSPELVKEYGKLQADRVLSGKISSATAQNLISSVNTVMRAATRGRWKSVSPTKDCNVPQRVTVRTKPIVNRAKIIQAINKLNRRQQALAFLALNLGLQSKEAALLDAHKALKQITENGMLPIERGSKGGRNGRDNRVIIIRTDSQKQTLEMAAEIQGKDRCLIPADLNWKEFKASVLREAVKILKAEAGVGMEGLRATYIVEYYEELTGDTAPCNGCEIKDFKKDSEARKILAKELGYNNVYSVSSYVGRRL